MKEYIPREAALNFEAEITAAPSEIQAISQGMSLYAEHIKAIPAADVAPLVHGWWIDDAGAEKCSVCKMRFPDLYPLYDAAHYCPNCGAKMGDADV